MKSYKIGFERLGIDLDKVNSTKLTTCPECSHERKQGHRNTKVLTVYANTGYYKCHHCDFSGRVDSDEWIEKQHKKELGLNVNGSESAQPTKPVKPTIEMKPFRTGQLTTKAIEFLNDRGISKETAEACKVAFHQGALCFNYYKEDHLIGAKYRLLDKKFFWQHAGCKKYLYGLNDIKDQDTIIIVEGEFDKLALYEVGFKNCVSVSQGAPNAGSEVGTKLQCLDNSIEYIKDAKRVILACDNDPNGKYLTEVLTERFGADRCAVVEFPENCKDTNDVLIQLGGDKLKELIDNAKDTPISGVRTLDQARPKMMDIYKNGIRKGVKTGIKELKHSFSYYRGWFYMWHGIPNSGKSAFVHFVMMCMSINHGWKWAVFSPEHYPEEDFYIDMIEILTGRNVELYNPDRLSEREFEIAMEFINNHFYFVYPEVDEMNNTLTNVLKKIKELKLSKGIDGYLIDPYNQLEREDDDQIAKGISKDLSRIANLDKTHNLVGNMVAHPRTLYKEKGEDDYKKTTPYQVEGGAMWYNKSDVIVNIHRPFNQSNKIDTSVEIDVQKVKSHKRGGRPKCSDMHYDRKTGWYMSLDGSCALDGMFEGLCKWKNDIKNAKGGKWETTIIGPAKELTFTEKMNGATSNISPAGYDLNQCPF